MEKRTKSELWTQAKEMGLTQGMKWTTVSVEELEAVLPDAPKEEPKEIKEPTGVEILIEGEEHCKHAFEFSFIQAIRGKPRVFADGREEPGERIFKDVYICTKCGAKQLRDTD